MTWSAIDDAKERAEETRPWMTPAEFEDVWRRFFFRARVMPAPLIVGINPPIAKRIIAGERPIKKVEALSVAHFLMGFHAPDLVGLPDEFAAWFAVHFGDAREPVGEWLELPKSARILDYCRGYAQFMGHRHVRLPGVGLVRALDWLRRVGPTVPFGREGAI